VCVCTRARVCVCLRAFARACVVVGVCSDKPCMRVQARIREQLMRFKLNDNEEVIQNMMSSYVTTAPRLFC
jgi:hypothetical protein